jgi:hypothetical protein
MGLALAIKMGEFAHILGDAFLNFNQPNFTSIRELAS